MKIERFTLQQLLELADGEDIGNGFNGLPLREQGMIFDYVQGGKPVAGPANVAKRSVDGFGSMPIVH